MSEEAEEWLSDGRDCHFCVIASTAKPTPHPTIAASPSASAYLVLSTHAVVGFLELAPMSRGHIILLPREHASKISELSSDASAVLGYWLPIANGKMAGQTIKHVHFHIIPRPRPEMKSLYVEAQDPSEMMMYEKRQEHLAETLNTKMQDEKGIEACQLIRAALKKEVLRMKLKGKIAEGDDEWDLWSMDDGKRMLQL